LRAFWEEALPLSFRAQAGLSRILEESIADSVVADGAVTAATANYRVVPEAVEAAPASGAESIDVRKRRSKPTLKGNLEKRRIDLAPIVSWRRS